MTGNKTALDLTTLKREARAKGTSETRLLELAALDVQLSRTIAKAAHTPLTVLEKLATSADMPTRRAVAANSHTPGAMLDKMAGDKQWTVLKAIAANPNATPPTLVQLLNHKQDSVWQAVLEQPIWPAEVQWAAAQHADVERRWRAARYRVLLPEVLAQLAQDKDQKVLLFLVRFNGEHLSPATLEGYLPGAEVGLRAAVAASSSNPALFQTFHTDSEAFVRASLLENPHLSRAWIAQLVQDILARPDQYDQQQLWNLTFHPHLSDEDRQAIEAIRAQQDGFKTRRV